MTPQELQRLIIGPQVGTGDYFDQTLLAQAKRYGELFPATPPASDQMDAYVLMNYYDLARSLYVAYDRTGDPVFLTLARKVADSWWLCPYSKGGTTGNFADGESAAPRLAGIIGLILRAIDGRPEMWDWITSYTRFHFDNWLKKRINDPQLYYGLREGAFMLSYATALANTHPDASVRTEMLTDVESVAVNYFGRLQKTDGSWRWDDWDASGGPYIGIMQPFMVGLTTRALCDVYAITTKTAVKESVKNQICNACRHLYSDGPFSRQMVVNFNVGLGGFHYFYHGGTQADPTKYESGDFPFDTTERWHVESARQAISTILGPFAYAYKISGDGFFKNAGEELYKFAYSGFDGFRAMMSDTAKNFNQHVLGNASFKAWMAAGLIPVEPPKPTQPLPIPPEPVKVPSPDGTKGTTIIDSQLATWTIGPQKQTLRDLVHMGGGQGSIYKYQDAVVYTLGTDSNWWGWVNSGWKFAGPDEPGIEPPEPEPPPVVLPPRSLPWPKQTAKQNTLLDAQWKERYRHKATDGSTAQFVHEPA